MAQRLRDVGASQFLTKPFSLAAMWDALDGDGDERRPVDAPLTGGLIRAQAPAVSERTGGIPSNGRGAGHRECAPSEERGAAELRRLLIYSHDTFGLGNMRRMTGIAEHLVERNPNLGVLTVSGSNALPAFDLPERIDCVKLPCVARDVQGYVRREGAADRPGALY